MWHGVIICNCRIEGGTEIEGGRIVLSYSDYPVLSDLTYSILAALSWLPWFWLSCLSWLPRSSPVMARWFYPLCSSFPVLVILFGCFVLAVLSVCAFLEVLSLNVLFWMSFSGCPLMVTYLDVICWMSGCGCPVLDVPFLLSCFGCPVLAVLFGISCSGCPVLDVLFWLSVLAILFWTPCPGGPVQKCPLPVVLIWIVRYHSGGSMKLNACILLLAHMVYL